MGQLLIVGNVYGPPKTGNQEILMDLSESLFQLYLLSVEHTTKEKS